MRAADKHLGFAASRYLQPVGSFSGTVKPELRACARHVQRLLGVTEHHQSLW